MGSVKAKFFSVMLLVALMLGGCSGSLGERGLQSDNPESQAVALQTLQYRLTQLVAVTQTAEAQFGNFIPITVLVTPLPQETVLAETEAVETEPTETKPTETETVELTASAPTEAVQEQSGIPVVHVTPVGSRAGQVLTQCYRAKVVTHVTVPDGTEVSAGERFVKTWQLKNEGFCTWESNTRLVFIGGEKMNGLEAQEIKAVVLPGGEMALSAEFTAPSQPGIYTGYWQMLSPDGQVFGTGEDGRGSFWVNIVVR